MRSSVCHCLVKLHFDSLPGFAMGKYEASVLVSTRWSEPTKVGPQLLRLSFHFASVSFLPQFISLPHPVIPSEGKNELSIGVLYWH